MTQSYVGFKLTRKMSEKFYKSALKRMLIWMHSTLTTWHAVKAATDILLLTSDEHFFGQLIAFKVVLLPGT